MLRNLSYSEFIRVRNFPLFSLGSIRGGFVYSQKTKREHPLGGIAERSIGYERIDENGYATRVGIDGAFGKDYLRGENGRRLKQRIGKGEWKPIRDINEIEPKNGYDIYTTIDVNIQDIAHHSLLGQLEKYEAEHGCVVVMDVKTGEIKAISNLGRNREGNYYERLNYAVGESHEPGSTFKVMAMMAALEDKVIDTSTVVDTKNGRKMFYGRPINDSGQGHGKISAAKALEVSSNIGLATIGAWGCCWRSSSSSMVRQTAATRFASSSRTNGFDTSCRRTRAWPPHVIPGFAKQKVNTSVLSILMTHGSRKK